MQGHPNHLIHRFIHTRFSLTISIFFGVTIALLCPKQWNLISKILIGWNGAVWFYLCLIVAILMHASHTKVKRIAEQEDKAAVLILVILSLAAITSLVAIVFELSSIKEVSLSHRMLRYALTASTVFASWCLVAILFTLHYARIFYASPVDNRALRFPDDEKNPDYWDFFYVSFTIAVAAQTSDVSVMTRSMRKAVMAQSILSFLFNVAILGFSINIAAGLVGS